MNAVVVNLYINGSVKLDTGNFVTKVLVFDCNIVNVIAVDFTEDASHMSDNTILAAIIDYIVAYDMRTNGFLAPSDSFCQEYGLHLIVITWFAMISCTEIVSGRGFFSDADGTAFCVVDNIVFDDPSLAPVCTEKSRLISGRRCPWASCLGHLKALDGNVIASCFQGIETAFTNIDLCQFFVWISTLEIGINCCCLVVCFAVPLINRIFRMKQWLQMFGPWRVDTFCAHHRMFYFFQRSCLVEGFSV